MYYKVCYQPLFDPMSYTKIVQGTKKEIVQHFEEKSARIHYIFKTENPLKLKKGGNSNV